MITVTKYEVFDGVPKFKNSFLVNLFIQMEEEKISDVVFRDIEKMDFKQWLWLFRSGYSRLYVVFDEGHPVALGWLTKMEHKSCHIHFCVFEKGRGTHSVEYGKELCKKIFYDFSCITAYVPIDNEKILHYSEKVGFKKVGMIPGFYFVAEQKKMIDCHVIYLPKED